MELEILKVAGQVAGIGGLAVGAIVLIYRDVIAKNIFPSLTKSQAYSLLKLVVVLSWSVAMAGIAAWTYVSVNSLQEGASTDNTGQISSNSPVVDWIGAAKTAKANKTIHSDRPLPNELVTKRAAFQEWWLNTPLRQKQNNDPKTLYEALSLTSRLYRMQELQSEKKPSANLWIDNAISYFEQIQNPEFLVESLLDKAAIYLELSQIEHTEAEEFREIAKEGDAVMARATSLANDKQKPGAYRIWSRFYYNLARPRDGNLSNDWDNNYLLVSHQKMQTAYNMQPKNIKNATQLARITQKAAANPPQDTDIHWTKKLREAQNALLSKWKENENTLTTPVQRIPPLNIIAVITLDLVRREWAESGYNATVSDASIKELEDEALPAQREVLALVRHTEWEEDYDFDMAYDLGRIYSLLVAIMDETRSTRSDQMFKEVIKNMKAARKAGSATQNDAAYQSIEGDPNLALLKDERKEAIKHIFRPS